MEGKQVTLTATLQLICTDDGPNERSVLTLQVATFNLEVDREQIEAALKHAAEQLAICVEFKRVSRLPVRFEEKEIQVSNKDSST